jgi:hypothetical protein
MTTLPKEQVTQRAAKTLVTYNASGLLDSTAVVVWAATTAGNDVTVTDQIGSDQDTRAEIDATLDADPTWEPA